MPGLPPYGLSAPLRIKIKPVLPPLWVGLHQSACSEKTAHAALQKKTNQTFSGRQHLAHQLGVNKALALYRLTLSAAKIPHRAFSERERIWLYTPATYSRLACREIAAALAENPPLRPLPPVAVHDNAFFAVPLLLLLLLWYAVCSGAFFTSGFSQAEWNAMGAADAFRMTMGGQWYRALTALTLHGDSVHVLGNILFGSIFLVPVCRRVGLGTGIFLTILAGFTGNILNALLQAEHHVSLGFSTSVFGAVGLLCGLYGAGTHRARLWVVIGAGAALLALLGSEGTRTDIMAHLLGALCGFILGIVAALPLRHGKQPPRWTGPLLGAMTLLALAGTWIYVVHLHLTAGG